jgi:hypothetical protein
MTRRALAAHAIAIAIAIAAAGVGACVASCVGAARAPDGTPPAAPDAITFRSCGPADGAAVTFVVPDTPIDCAAAERPAVAHLALELWSPSLLEAGSATLSGSSGAARACTAAGECRELAGATLTVRSEPDGTPTGTVTYTDGGRRVTRAFRAASCQVRMICG